MTATAREYKRMSQARYVQRTDSEIRHLLEEKMGFSETEYTAERWGQRFIPWERVWERQVVTKSGKEFPYRIVCYSTVDRRTNVTRDCAKDAIRFVLLSDSGKPITRAEKCVYRTKGALDNILERARELYRFVGKSETCPKCNSLMDEREVKKEGPNKGKKFLGCTRYPDCNGTVWDHN